MHSCIRKVLVVLGAVIAAMTVLTVIGALIFVVFVGREIDRVASGDGDSLPDAPAADQFGTPGEVGTRGDRPNPRELYDDLFPSDAETQERAVGDLPARFSGYTVWLDSVELVPAARHVDTYRGDYVRIEFHAFNRDTEAQTLEPQDFALWRHDEGFRVADVVGSDDEFARAVEMSSGATQSGVLYLYVGEPRGDVFVRFDPDRNSFDGNESIGVWQVLDGGRPVVPASE
jgi:hypothetical protein